MINCDGFLPATLSHGVTISVRPQNAARPCLRSSTTAFDDSRRTWLVAVMASSDRALMSDCASSTVIRTSLPTGAAWIRLLSSDSKIVTGSLPDRHDLNRAVHFHARDRKPLEFLREHIAHGEQVLVDH